MDFCTSTVVSEPALLLISKVNDELSICLQELHIFRQSNCENIVDYKDLRVVIFGKDSIDCQQISLIREKWPYCFIACVEPDAQQNPHIRLELFDVGANQVAHCLDALLRTLTQNVLPFIQRLGSIRCPICGLAGMNEEGFWHHLPTYHINVQNDSQIQIRCPICRVDVGNTPLQVHVHEEHGPIRRGLTRSEVASSHLKTQLYAFALVVCRHPSTGKYLLCQEFANQGFWLPGGAVDGGEVLSTAAIRETQEEAGVDVELKGVLAMEYHPCGVSQRSSSHIVRMRVVFYAEPTEAYWSRPPKSSPDFESAGACWCSVDDIESGLRLRGSEPRKWSRYLSEGGAIYPLSILAERDC